MLHDITQLPYYAIPYYIDRKTQQKSYQLNLNICGDVTTLFHFLILTQVPKVTSNWASNREIHIHSN